MKRIDQIAALSVVDVQTGKRLGKVDRVFLDGSRRKMLGISLKTERWFGQRGFISFDDIALFGRFSLLVVPRVDKRMPQQTLTLGSRVYGLDGRQLGWYTNALIEEISGSIWALEYSGGFLEDLKGERCWVRAFSCGAESISVLSEEPMLRS